MFGQLEAFHGAGRYPEAANAALRAASISDLSPKMRLRLFPQAMIAGPAYWQAKLSETEIERLYLRSESAAPLAPLLLDMRLRYLLSRPLDETELAEVESKIQQFKALLGYRNSGPHILDAALALRVSDLPRADASLGLAKALLPDDKVDATGARQNYESLVLALKKARNQE